MERSLGELQKKTWIGENPTNNVDIVLKKFPFLEQSQF